MRGGACEAARGARRCPARRAAAHLNVRLRREVVQLMGADARQQLAQVGAVRQVAVLEEQAQLARVAVVVQVLDAPRVEGATAPDQPMHHVALCQQKLG